MPMINVNLDEVDEFEPIPTAQYLCRITKAEEVLSHAAEARGEKEKDMISCEAEVAEGEHEGRVLFFNTMIWTKKGKVKKVNYYLRRLIEALGVEWTAKGFQTEDMMGCEFIANVEPPDVGQRFNKVTDYLPPS